MARTSHLRRWLNFWTGFQRSGSCTRVERVSEPLEPRVLLSISGAPLAGPFQTAGTVWTYNLSDASGDTATFTNTAAGPATFNGNAGYEVDYATISTSSGAVRPGSGIKEYQGLDNAGDVVYFGADTTVTNASGGLVGTDHDVYSPAELVFPPAITAGVAFSSNYTDTQTATQASKGSVTTSVDNFADTSTLQSETTTPVTVPAGTFNCYEITTTQVDTSTDGNGNPTSDTSSTDSFYAPGVGMVKSTAVDDSQTTNYQLAAFKATGAQLRFLQPPTNVAATGTLNPPVTVQVLNSDGADNTTATDPITLSLAAVNGNGTGTLGGTMTENAVGGVATFSDLTVSAPGQYYLSASDPNAANPVASTPFDVSDGKLVFVKPPHNGDADVPLNPGVSVKLVNSKGQLITDEDGSTVTLITVGVTGGASIAGNTAVLSGGIASFPKLNFADAGTYTLQASDADGDAETNSGPFTIAGTHLAFKELPTTVDTFTPFGFDIVVKNARGQTVQSADSINVATTASFLPSSGDNSQSVLASAGVAHFNYSAVIAAGTFAFVATDRDDDTVASATGTIKVLGDHLVFRSFPKTVDTDTPFSFAVLVENSKNQIIHSTDNINVTTKAVAFPPSAVNSQTVPANDGVAHFDDSGVSSPGTFPYVATDTNSSDTLSATATIKVLSDHLVFRNFPKTVDSDTPFSFAVLVENSKNQILRSTDDINVTSTAVSVPPSADNTQTVSAEDGVAHFQDSGVSFPGTFPFVATDTNNTDIFSVTAMIKVLGNHLVYRNVPSTVHVSKPFTFAVVIEDAQDHVVTSDNDDIVVYSSGPSLPNTGISLTAPAENGVAQFSDATLYLAGDFSLVATDAEGGSNVTKATVPITAVA